MTCSVVRRRLASSRRSVEKERSRVAFATGNVVKKWNKCDRLMFVKEKGSQTEIVSIMFACSSRLWNSGSLQSRRDGGFCWVKAPKQNFKAPFTNVKLPYWRFSGDGFGSLKHPSTTFCFQEWRRRVSITAVHVSDVRIWKVGKPDPIRNFFMNSISKPYPNSNNFGLRYPSRIRDNSLICTLV